MKALTAALKVESRLRSLKPAIRWWRFPGLAKKCRSIPGPKAVKGVFSGEHVFLALPPALAAKIEFNPTMPEQVLSNWRKIPTWMAPHAKYVAVYKTDLLRERQLSGNAGSRVGPMVEIHDVSEPDSGKTAILVLLAYRQNRDGLSAKLFSKIFAGSSLYAYLDWMRQNPKLSI